MKDQSRAVDAATASVVARNRAVDQLVAHGHVRVECFDASGRLKWVEDGPNLIVTAGRNKLLDETLAGAAYTAAWYVGLIDNAGFSAIAAADTMASHAGWTESTAYDEAARQALTFAAAASGSKATDSPATVTISATATINGLFVVSDSTKGGSTGVLFAAKSFAAPRAVVDGDTLNLSYSASLTAS